MSVRGIPLIILIDLQLIALISLSPLELVEEGAPGLIEI